MKVDTTCQTECILKAADVYSNGLLAATQLENAVNSVPAGEYILIGVQDTGKSYSSSSQTRINNVLKSLGATTGTFDTWRQSYALIGKR